MEHNTQRLRLLHGCRWSWLSRFGHNVFDHSHPRDITMATAPCPAIGAITKIVGLMKEVPKYEIHDFEKIEVEI
jgi:hypothetical protein